MALLFAFLPLLQATIHRTQVMDNDSVLVARLVYEPAAREDVHTHPFSAVVIALTPGNVEMTTGDDKTVEPRQPGFSWFIPKDAPHAAANLGTSRFETVTIALKPSSRARTPEGPALPVPRGITRTPLLENAETRVVRVQFEPGAREEVHTHPFDLLVIQITPGQVEVLEGSQKRLLHAPAGFVLFLAKDVPHAVANVGASGFTVLSVAVK